MNDVDTQLLIDTAQAGDPLATDRLLQIFREPLKVIAVRELRGQSNVDWDPSDAVQESLLEAHRDFAHFRGRTESEFLGWLETILNHNLADRAKYRSREKRRAESCMSLDATNSLGMRLQDLLSADQSSVHTHFIRYEDHRRLSQALLELPDHEAQAVRLRHLQGLPLDEIAKIMRRSRASIAGLLIRGLRRLSEGLSGDSQG